MTLYLLAYIITKFFRVENKGIPIICNRTKTKPTKSILPFSPFRRDKTRTTLLTPENEAEIVENTMLPDSLDDFLQDRASVNYYYYYYYV